MKITVVTANYNGGRWLGRCMDSVLGQELPAGDELEYVFVGGAGTSRWRSRRRGGGGWRRS